MRRSGHATDPAELRGGGHDARGGIGALTTHRPLRVWFAGSFLLALLVGCEQGKSSPETTGPKETLFALTRAHSARNYDEFRRLVLVQRRDGLVSTLRAVDRFLAAERTLRAVILHSFGREFAEIVDLSRFAAHLGVFSADVKLLDERIVGQRAIVTYLVAGMPPAREAALVRVDGHWRYDPGEGFSPAWPRAFEEMAGVLDQMANEVKTGDGVSQRVYADPQAFLQELASRLSVATEGLPTSQPGDGG